MSVRIHEAGNRYAGHGDECIDETTGKINWGKLGPYALEYAIVDGEEIAVTLIHRPTGDVQTIADYKINHDYQLLYLWDDMAAVAKKGMITVKLAAAFEPSKTGPFRLPRLAGKSKHWEAIVKQQKELYTAKQDNLTEKLIAVDTESFVSPKKQQNQEAFKRARAMLQQKQEQRK